LDTGLTVTELPLRFPGNQVKVAAPEAIKVAVSPAQIDVVLLLIAGKAFTSTLTVCEPLQLPVEPVTV
jgi:hypothetical protein